jgi:HNH endonuclease
MENQYRDKRWIKFCEELIELDGGACVRCGRTREDGAILQVHHKQYLSGKLPWEYPFELCETLCKRCHAEEHGKIRPETGWEFVGADDLGDLCGNCERCGTEIRHVFLVQHPEWAPMAVGTVCCDNLTGSAIASEKRKHNDRLKRFMRSKRWSEEGGRHLIRQKQFNIQIIPEAGEYRIIINNKKGSQLYPSLEAAKTRVFDFIESGEADKFFYHTFQ